MESISNFGDTNIEDVQPLPFFHGMELENPYLHMQKFEKWCLIEFQEFFDENMCADRIYFKVFPHTLKDDAKFWFEALPHDSFTTWLKFQATFYTRYLSNFLIQVQRQQAMKQQILNFTQLDGESYSQAWERFNDLVFSCQHHGFHDEHLLEIFYMGLLPSSQEFVWMRSNREFVEYSTEDTWWYLKRLAECEQTAPSKDQSLTYEDDGQYSQEEHNQEIRWSQVDEVEDPYVDENEAMNDGVCVNHMGDTMQFYFSKDDDVEMCMGKHEIEDIEEPEPSPQFDECEYNGKPAEKAYFDDDDDDDMFEGMSVPTIIEPTTCLHIDPPQPPPYCSAQDSYLAIDHEDFQGGLQNLEITAKAIHSNDKDEANEGKYKMIYIEPHLPPPIDLPQQPSPPPDAKIQPEHCTTFQGNFHQPMPYISEFHSSIPYISDSECRHLNSNQIYYYDDWVWNNFIEHHTKPTWIDTAHLTQDKGIYHNEVLGVALLESKKDRGASMLKQLTEGHKEMIEQLPPPSDIRDPPFIHGVLFPVV